MRVMERSPWWTWLALTAGMCGGGVIAVGLDDTIAFSYVIGGILSAVPLFAWGQRLRSDS